MQEEHLFSAELKLFGTKDIRNFYPHHALILTWLRHHHFENFNRLPKLFENKKKMRKTMKMRKTVKSRKNSSSKEELFNRRRPHFWNFLILPNNGKRERENISCTGKTKNVPTKIAATKYMTSQTWKLYKETQTNQN